jgi:hypothetical protein
MSVREEYSGAVHTSKLPEMEVQEQASHAAGEEDMDHVLTLQQTKPMSKSELSTGLLKAYYNHAGKQQH